MNEIIEFLSNEMIVILVAAMPIMELKGAIPIGVSMGMNPIYVLVLGIIGSTLPVPFLLLFLKPVFERMKRSSYWKKFIDWVTKRTMKKSGKIHKYKALGLFIFVAIPLPSTGVWTGSLAASLLNIPFRSGFLAIFLGNCVAGLIMTTLSHMAVGL